MGTIAHPACSPGVGTDGSASSSSSSFSSAPAQYVSDDCKLSGCGGFLCIGKDDADQATTCEWKDPYACYFSARCEKQANGLCGWTMTSELSACLMDPPKTRKVD